MAKVKRVKYFTKDKKKLINKENIKKYQKYLRSNVIKNKEVENTTYLVYENYMNHFLVYLAENYGDIDLYSEEFMEEAVDIMEGFIAFCQDTLFNNKKVINTKISAVSSFYHWSVKRKFVQYHPFDKRLDRMKGANEEKIINSYFLNDEEVAQIREGLKDNKKFDIQDILLFEIMYDSANRIGAISKLSLKDMDLDECVFTNVREKRGYRVEVPFEEDTRDMIEDWLEYRKESLDNLEVDALFITRYRGEWRAMAKGTLQERVRKIGTILGLEDFHSHCLRKSKLNDIYVKTGDLSLASEYANHKSTDTTRQSYIKPMSKAETREKIKELMKKAKENK